MKKLRLTPLSLGVKCQLMFGLTMVLSLVIAVTVPYIWMTQLVRNDYLDNERIRTQTLLTREHYQPKIPDGTEPVILDDRGLAADPNNMNITWIRIDDKAGTGQDIIESLPEKQRDIIKELQESAGNPDDIEFTKRDDRIYSSYIRVVRAGENCISCHNSESTATPFSPAEIIGVVISEQAARDLGKISFINRLWSATAALIGGIGAVVAFYLITQRFILRPIRQLRALVNNVADGNLNIRSSIKTGDEYQRLSESFNHMLDNLQQTQQKLRQANKELDAKIAQLSERNIELFKANKLKSEFLANISHEFRTPLNSIIGFAQVLREKSKSIDPNKLERYSQNILTGGNRLLNMMTDLLDLAKAQAGKLELHITEESLANMLRELVMQFSIMSADKQLDVTLDIQSNLPVLRTDTGKVQQILYNLLSNAVKFTPEKGRIVISAELAPGEKSVRISISDTGCGVAEKDISKIFQKFASADGSLTRTSGGSGLGLAISAELAALLAGTITVESEQGKGATFCLEIPVTITKKKFPENDE